MRLRLLAVSKKRSCLLALMMCVLASCGGSSPEATEAPSPTVAPTDTDRAANLVLRTSDLPSGFAAVDVRSATSTPMVNQCLTPLLVAGATQIGEVFVRDDDEISTQSYVLASTDAARQAVFAPADSTAQTCLMNLLQSRIDESKAASGRQDVPTSASTSGLDAATARYRVVAVQSSGDTTRTVATEDLLLVQADRSVSAVWLTWTDGSPDDALEKSLITALRARAAAALPA